MNRTQKLILPLILLLATSLSNASCRQTPCNRIMQKLTMLLVLAGPVIAVTNAIAVVNTPSNTPPTLESLRETGVQCTQVTARKNGGKICTVTLCNQDHNHDYLRGHMERLIGERLVKFDVSPMVCPVEGQPQGAIIHCFHKILDVAKGYCRLRE